MVAVGPARQFAKQVVMMMHNPESVGLLRLVIGEGAVAVKNHNPSDRLFGPGE
jgi:hypothetical protein